MKLIITPLKIRTNTQIEEGFMKRVIFFSILTFNLTAFAQKPCEQQMSNAAYSAYARSEKISVQEARNRADLFPETFKTLNDRHIFEVELAEQYTTDSESGYFPGTKFKIVLTKSCQLVSISKI